MATLDSPHRCWCSVDSHMDFRKITPRVKVWPIKCAKGRDVLIFDPKIYINEQNITQNGVSFLKIFYFLFFFFNFSKG